MFNIKQFHFGFSTLYYTIIKYILHGNGACSMCFNWREWASKKGCFIRRYSSDPAIYSTLPAPKKLPCTLCSILNSFIMVFQHYIILLASVFYIGIVRAVFVSIGENARRKTGVLSEDIAAILLCTVLYLHRKSSHALYVQYNRVSLWFFNVFECRKQVYFTWE